MEVSKILIKLNVKNYNSLFNILILNAQADPDAIKNIAKDEIIILYKLSGDGDRILYFKEHMREEISKFFEYVFQLNRVDPYSKIYFNIGGILRKKTFEEPPILVKLIKEFQSISFYKAYYIEEKDTIRSEEAIDISPLGLYNLIHSPGRYPQQLLNSMAINLPFLYYVTGNEIYYNDFKMIIPGYISTLLIYLYKVYPAHKMLHYLIWHNTLRQILNSLSGFKNCRYIVDKFNEFIDEYICKFNVVKPNSEGDMDPRKYLNYIKDVNVASCKEASKLASERIDVCVDWEKIFKNINKILIGRLFNLDKSRGRDIIDICEDVYRSRDVFKGYSRVIYPLIITEQATLPDIFIFKDVLQNYTEVQTIIFPTTSTILNYLLLIELVKLIYGQKCEKLLENVYIISDDTWYTYNLFINIFKKNIGNLTGKVAILIDKNLKIYGSGAQFTSFLLATKKVSKDYKNRVDIINSRGERIF